MDQDDRIRGDVIQQIMCHGFVAIEALQVRHGIVFEDYFSSEMKRLQPLRADGLVEMTDAQIRLTPAGQLLMRAVAMTVDAYLSADAEAATMSRVVSES